MVGRKAAGLMAIALLFPAARAGAYYEESLRPGAEVTEIEIIDQGSPGTSSGIMVRDLGPSPAPKPVPGYLPQPGPAAPPVQQAPAYSTAPVQAPAVSTAHPASRSGVTYVGSQPGKAAAVSGKGSKMPLGVAAAMIVPKGWDVETGAQASHKTVTFNANRRPWTLVLEDFSRDTGVPMVVNWRNGTVMIGKGAPAAQTASTQPASAPVSKGGIVRKAIISEPGRADAVARRYKVNTENFCRWNHFGPSAWLDSGTEVYLEAPPDGTIVVSNIPVRPTDPMAGKKLPPIPEGAVFNAAYTPGPEETIIRSQPAGEYGQASHVYAVSPGSLSSQLAQWCMNAGYELVWKVNGDYDITSYSAFGPDFKKALVQLFDSLMESGEPLRATVYERNHIVEINED